jgi:ParB/RepB/Spo0J family partition protein
MTRIPNIPGTRRPSMGERAAEEAQRLLETPASGASPRTGNPQTLGATKRLVEAVEGAKILRTESFPTEKISLRDGIFNRSEDAFQGAEWLAFVDSIKQTNGNTQPADVIADPEHSGRFLLVTGERRYRACKALGLQLTANVRRMSEAEIDLVFSMENRYRKGKSIYENGRLFHSLLAKGRYADFGALVDGLKENKSTVSEALALVDALTDAQCGALTEPHKITVREARVLMRAKQHDPAGLAQAIDSLIRSSPHGKVRAKLAVGEAQALVEPAPRKVRAEAARARLVRHKGETAIALPSGLSDVATKRLLKAVEEALAKLSE